MNQENNSNDDNVKINLIQNYENWKEYMKAYRTINKNKIVEYKQKYKNLIETLKENNKFCEDVKIMNDQNKYLKYCVCVWCDRHLCNWAIRLHLVNKHYDHYKP